MGVARAQPSTEAPSCPARPHAPPPANGCGGSLGKFPFRFLLPPVPLLLRWGASPGSPHPWCRSNPPLSPPLPSGPRTGCRPSNVWWWEMGRYLAELPQAPAGSPETLLHRCPWGSPLTCRSPWEAARRNCPFSQEPEGAPGWAEDSFTLSVHLTLEASWVAGIGLRVGVPGAPCLY